MAPGTPEGDDRGDGRLEWCIVHIATGEVVVKGFDSRGEANAARWENYETGEADTEYEPRYGVEVVYHAE